MLDHVGKVLGRVRVRVRRAVGGALLVELEERLRAELEGRAARKTAGCASSLSSATSVLIVAIS